MTTTNHDGIDHQQQQQQHDQHEQQAFITHQIGDAHPLLRHVKHTVLLDSQVLPSEPQEGNIEYKLKLIDPTPERLVHLTTQMKWRLAEGGGEAIYQIGVGDDGSLHGLSVDELQLSLHTLATMAERVGATFTLLRRSPSIDGKSHIAEVHVRRADDAHHFVDVRVLVMGDSGCGKSTLIGCLSSGKCDSGKGLTRLDMFRHNHEVVSGRTSSLSTEVIGFDGEGHVLNYDENMKQASVKDVCANATKVVHITDSPGFEKYERTTLFGLSSRLPDHVCVCVDGTKGLTPQATRQFTLSLALNLPIFIVITKIDKCDKQRLKTTLVQVMSKMKSAPYNKVPLIVKKKDDVLTYSRVKVDARTVPIMLVSNVKRTNFNLLLQHLNLLPTINQALLELQSREPSVVLVEETFQIDGSTIVGGKVAKGLIRVNDELKIGPNKDGSFSTTIVTSIQRNRRYVTAAKAGQVASFAISIDDVRRGQVLCAVDVVMNVWRTFVVDLLVLNEKDMLKNGLQCTMFLNNIRQTVFVNNIEVVTTPVDDAMVCEGGSSQQTSSTVMNTTHRVTVTLANNSEIVNLGDRCVLDAAPFQAIGNVIDLCG
eukprot:m.216809 g.216809  ORF g.216809 m.216809 type:complete len:596 (-) comp13810_c0_seq5:2845-4632(-)